MSEFKEISPTFRTLMSFPNLISIIFTGCQKQVDNKPSKHFLKIMTNECTFVAARLHLDFICPGLDSDQKVSLGISF